MLKIITHTRLYVLFFITCFLWIPTLVSAETDPPAATASVWNNTHRSVRVSWSSECHHVECVPHVELLEPGQTMAHSLYGKNRKLTVHYPNRKYVFSLKEEEENPFCTVTQIISRGKTFYIR